MGAAYSPRRPPPTPVWKLVQVPKGSAGTRVPWSARLLEDRQDTLGMPGVVPGTPQVKQKYADWVP